MIDLYTWCTPNGRKVSILLEETGLAYRVHPVNISRGEQFAPDFLRISPNNKIPAIVDHDGPGGAPLALFESGAILTYLAEKTGRFLPADPAERYTTLAWLFFQAAHVGPMFGQAHHFRSYAPERIPYAIDRYAREVRRLYCVLDERLARAPYLGGAAYSIADIANFTWTRSPRAYGIDANRDHPHVARWIHAIDARDAVRRGLEIPASEAMPMDERAREALFGAMQENRGPH
jgi:GST-like protein